MTTTSIYRQSLIFYFFFEVISFLGFLYPDFSSGAFLIMIGLAIALSLVSLDLAVLLLLAELFVGSQGGYLVSFGSGGGGPGHGIDVSLRIGLFLVVFATWAASSITALMTKDAERREHDLRWYSLMKKSGLLWPYLALLAAFAFAALMGFLHGNDKGNIFFDANGYAFFALFPAVIGAVSEPRFRKILPGVLFAAVTISVAKALFVLFVFSHRMLYVAPYIYAWVRDARVGEITKMVGDFYRVFFQSHVYAMVLVLIIFPLAVYAADWKDRRVRGCLAVAGLAFTGVMMGFSRSFWFGLMATAAGMAALFIWAKAPVVIWRRTVILGFSALCAAAAIILSVYYFPIPQKGSSISFASLFGSRATSLGDSAANSRWQLLPVLMKADMRHPVLGSGFGTTVTYKTSDPRLLADNPTGEYTTYAFEWGYQDLWLKLGLVGLAVYGWLLWVILRPAMYAVTRNRQALGTPGLVADGGQKEKAVFAVGASLAILALLATNIFSPYLNHPLGIGILMLTAAYGAIGAFGE